MTRDQADYALVHVMRAKHMLEVTIEDNSPFTGAEIEAQLKLALKFVGSRPDEAITVQWGAGCAPSSRHWRFDPNLRHLSDDDHNTIIASGPKE